MLYILNSMRNKQQGNWYQSVFQKGTSEEKKTLSMAKIKYNMTMFKYSLKMLKET